MTMAGIKDSGFKKVRILKKSPLVFITYVRILCEGTLRFHVYSPRALLVCEQALGRNGAEIHGLRRLRGRGKSVSFMRECPGPLVVVSR